MSHPQIEPSAPSDRRIRQRVTVDCPAELALLSTRLECRMRDISASGARLELAAPPLVPSMGMLRWDGHEVYCSVVWANQTQCGIAFERAIEAELVAETVARHGETTEAVIADVGQIAWGAKRKRADV